MPQTRYEIRLATRDDIDDLVRMQIALQESMVGLGTCMLRLAPQTLPQLGEYYRTQIADEQARVLIAEDTLTARRIGMGMGKIWLHAGYIPSRSGELIDLWIEREHRRQGLAKRLIDRLLRFFRNNQVAFLAVNYAQGSRLAESTWKRLGFSPVLVTATAARCEVERALRTRTNRIVSIVQDTGLPDLDLVAVDAHRPQ